MFRPLLDGNTILIMNKLHVQINETLIAHPFSPDWDQALYKLRHKVCWLINIISRGLLQIDVSLNTKDILIHFEVLVVPDNVSKNSDYYKHGK